MTEFLLKDESPSKSHIRSTIFPISVENKEISKLQLFVTTCNKPQKETATAATADRRRQGADWTGQRTGPGGQRRAGNAAASGRSLNFNLLLFLAAELFREHLFSAHVLNQEA